ncbi:mitochondrial carrier domain-containing protein [Vararia minispora EC-137]|uniref:Mitochondrial carrier domain-containing protein n=1 Tax=Vararia minispora EC-137 TaxID=1314806 RepID=A0ACB8Q8S9_9AGAM|nr:mitochondrial carrier domain-containing protein [Vararia minispora EC-137]
MSVQSKLSSGPPKQLTPFGYALAGALGGCFSNAVVYPLDTIKTRIQAAEHDTEDTESTKEDLSILGLVQSILREDGFAGFFRGFSATMLNTFSMQYAYFFFYSIVRGRYLKRVAARAKGVARALSTPEELLLGALAGALAQIFTIPVAVIATRQQIGQHMRRKDGVHGDDTFLGVAREIVREEGVSGLWLGLKPGLVLTVNPAITYGVFERVRGTLLLARTAAGSPDTKLGPWTSFVLGATSKTLATIVTYPYIMAKIRIQTRSADAEDARAHHTLPGPTGAPHHHPGALDILIRVWKNEGFLGWYQGMGAQVLKAVLAQGVLFMSKEKFEHWALAIMVLWWRLSSRA